MKALFLICLVLAVSACGEPIRLRSTDIREKKVEAPPTPPGPIIDYFPPPPSYRYVRVTDLSGELDGTNAGADIDAIVLQKADGRDLYAETLIAFQPGSQATIEDWDPKAMLGPPDSVTDIYSAYPACDADAGFVSLGGDGFLLVEMPDFIEVGDFVVVVEVGNCDSGNGAQLVAETVEIAVSSEVDPDAVEGKYWVTLGRGEGPFLGMSVTSLP